MKIAATIVALLVSVVFGATSELANVLYFDMPLNMQEETKAVLAKYPMKDGYNNVQHVLNAVLLDDAWKSDDSDVVSSKAADGEQDAAIQDHTELVKCLVSKSGKADPFAVEGLYSPYDLAQIVGRKEVVSFFESLEGFEAYQAKIAEEKKQFEESIKEVAPMMAAMSSMMTMSSIMSSLSMMTAAAMAADPELMKKMEECSKTMMDFKGSDEELVEALKTGQFQGCMSDEEAELLAEEMQKQLSLKTVGTVEEISVDA